MGYLFVAFLADDSKTFRFAEKCVNEFVKGPKATAWGVMIKLGFFLRKPCFAHRAFILPLLTRIVTFVWTA
jgi:hypothetical protein